MQDGNLYINGTYIKGGIISGQTIEGGSFTTYSNGYIASRLKGSGLKLYDWAGDRSLVGALGSIHNNDTNRGHVALYSDANSAITIGYTTGNPDEGSVEVIPVFSFDPEKPNSAPYIINTVDGTIFPDNLNGGITVENGLITGWSMHAVKDNTLSVIVGMRWANGSITSITFADVQIKNGLISSWSARTENY